MNPRLVLSLWRERWGKAGNSTVMVPYLEGKLTHWGKALTQASAWNLPGARGIAFLISGFLLLLTISVGFSLSAQLIFSACLICAASYFRRYAGTLVTLFLISLSIVVSSRYLQWRFSSTLGQEFNWDLIFGLGLWIAEFYLWVFMTLGFVQTIWPLRRAQELLPVDTSEWPTVDVYIPCHDRSEAAIRKVTAAARALKWPANKLNVYVLDQHQRDEIREIAESEGARYLVNPDNSDGKVGSINSALAHTQGSIIAILDCDQAPPEPHLLDMTVGWFLDDMKLGMLQTPNHFLAPSASVDCLKICQQGEFQASFAIIRRSMMLEVGGITAEPVTMQAHIALKLQEQGYGHAMIGFSATSAPPVENRTQNSGLQRVIEPEFFRVDHPNSGCALFWKRQLASLLAMLHFYSVVPRLVFLITPVAYLLGGLQIIQTTPELLLAYFLPHLLHAHFARSRLKGKSRFSAWRDVKETALAWYMLVPTAWTLLRTEIGRIKNAFRTKAGLDVEPFDWILKWPYGIILALNLCGCIAGMVSLAESGAIYPPMTALHLGWATGNLLLLAARLAVAEESRHIRHHTRLQLELPAMVQLPSGRTLSCVTENFPESTLCLRLPTPTTLAEGTFIGLSIFRSHREFTFPAQITFRGDRFLRVNILDTAQTEYRLLGSAALSRDQQWPKWLPGPNADRPLPLWLTRPIASTFAKIEAGVNRLGWNRKWANLISWLNEWKRTT